MKKNNKRILNLVMVLALSAAMLVGCAATPKQAAAEPHDHSHEPAVAFELFENAGGVLCLKINPELAVHYDENGKVTKVEARNADGARILANFSGYEGKETSVVLEELVKLIGKAGYFVEEAEGAPRKVVLELDPGSDVPHDTFLQDMASHVKLCIENKEWVGEQEFEYAETVVPTEAETEPEPEQKETAPTEAAKKETAEKKATSTAAKKETTAAKKETATKKSTTSTKIPEGLCPVCADDDCDDGKYCDDADEKEENLREYEAEQAAKKKAASVKIPEGLCQICGDDDCDDGAKCDDADDLEENLKEYEAEKKAKESSKKSSGSAKKASTSTKKATTSTKKATTSTKKKTTTSKVPAGLCPICADDDCDDGKYCDDADEKAENLREYEANKNKKACPKCGEKDCDDGKYCDGD